MTKRPQLIFAFNVIDFVALVVPFYSIFIFDLHNQMDYKSTKGSKCRLIARWSSRLKKRI